MAVFTQSISAADVLAGLTTDSTKWAGANIANLDLAISKLLQTVYLNTDYTWTEAVDGTVDCDITMNLTELPAIGRWRIKGQFTTLGNSDDYIQFHPLYEAATDFLQLELYDSNAANHANLEMKIGNVQVVLIQSGVAASGTAEHYYDIDRDGVGRFELSEDGVSIGTAQDDEIPTAVNNYIKFGSHAGGSVYVLKELYHQRLSL